MSFLHPSRIHLHDTDAAGVLFFANQFRLAHEAYEAFLDSIGMPLKDWIAGPVHLPIVHAQADFTAPLRAGDVVQIEVTSDALGDHSFKMLYRFRKDGQAAVGSAQTAHVAVDAKTGLKTRLPETLRAALRALTE